MAVRALTHTIGITPISIASVIPLFATRMRSDMARLRLFACPTHIEYREVDIILEAVARRKKHNLIDTNPGS